MAKKPTNDRIAYSASAGELTEALEIAMGYVCDAMEELKGYAEFAEWFDVLDGIDCEMQAAHERYEASASADYADQVRELEREYWRSVL